jgi:lipopolysaccharide transport system permease protein
MIVILFGLLAVYHLVPTVRILALPLFFVLATLTATGVSLWFSALSVKYRDFMHTLPFLIQVWFYASPVVYSATLVPARWRTYFALNPAVGFIEGIRWSALGHSSLNVQMLWITIAASVFAFLSGVLFFRRVEREFADVI